MGFVALAAMKEVQVRGKPEVVRTWRVRMLGDPLLLRPHLTSPHPGFLLPLSPAHTTGHLQLLLITRILLFGPKNTITLSLSQGDNAGKTQQEHANFDFTPIVKGDCGARRQRRHAVALRPMTVSTDRQLTG